MEVANTLLTIIGTRPQYIKASVVSNALWKLGIKEVIVDTNQHYDPVLNDNIVDSIPFLFNNKVIQVPPTISFEKKLCTTEKIVKPFLKKCKYILVYGDTNSTLIGALIAQKNNKKLIHIEAGERSYNEEMLEERNRICVDYLSTVCLCTNNKAKLNISYNSTTKKHIIGDVMLDAFMETKKRGIVQSLSSKSETIYFTLHRKENTRNSNAINTILNTISVVKGNIIWPMHPRLFKIKNQLVIPKNIKVVKPLNYLQSITLLHKAKLVITDSGGLQKEAYWMKRKCITLRGETEWTETLEGNWNTLLKKIAPNNFKKALMVQPKEKTWSLVNFGNGSASIKAAKIIAAYTNA